MFGDIEKESRAIDLSFYFRTWSAPASCTVDSRSFDSKEKDVKLLNQDVSWCTNMQKSEMSNLIYWTSVWLSISHSSWLCRVFLHIKRVAVLSNFTNLFFFFLLDINLYFIMLQKWNWLCPVTSNTVCKRTGLCRFENFTCHCGVLGRKFVKRQCQMLARLLIHRIVSNWHSI